MDLDKFDVMSLLMEFATAEAKASYEGYRLEARSVIARTPHATTESGHIYTFLSDGKRWTLYDDARKAEFVDTSADAQRKMLTESLLVEFRLTFKGRTVVGFQFCSHKNEVKLRCF